jgi:hypothetical protein
MILIFLSLAVTVIGLVVVNTSDNPRAAQTGVALAGTGAVLTFIFVVVRLVSWLLS